MKRIILYTAFIFLLPQAKANAQKLTLIEQNYELAKVEAQKQGKLLLIDFYTTWCIPCKELDRLIFNDSTVTKQIAKNFVVLKYDAEKDQEHQLSLKYHILSYPTTLVLNQDQRILNRAYGHPGEEQTLVKNYLVFLGESLTKNTNNDFVKGVSNLIHLDYPKFYKDYVYRIDTKNYKPALAQFWQTNTNYFGELEFAILCYFGGATDEVNAFFLKNKARYIELYGERDVKFIISMWVSDKFHKAIETKNRVLFATALKLSEENFAAKDLIDYHASMEQKMLQAENHWQEAANNLEKRMKQPGFGNWAISSFCWDAFEHCNDIKVLKKCAVWMKNLTDQKPAYATLDTYAQLLSKIGNKKEAVVIMQKAVKIGKQEKENTQSSEDWLKKNG
jgi:thiol-disulfide isomerase/thioredoxin